MLPSNIPTLVPITLRLGGVTTSDTVSFTCPADTSVVLDTVLAANTTAALTKFTLTVGGRVLFANESVPAAQAKSWIKLGQVLRPGETVSAWSTVNGSLTLLLTGLSRPLYS